MGLICTIDVFIILALVSVATTQGLEAALPVFAFFVTLMPNECRLVLPGLFDLPARRLMLIVVAIIFFSQAKKSAIRTVPLKNLLLLHTSWIVVSTLISIVILTSVKQLLAQVIEYYLTYYIIVKTITDVRTITRIAFAMVAAIGLACVFGVIEIYGGWTILSIFPPELQETYGSGSPLYAEMMERGLRVRSTFPHPILFGGAISMMVPLAMSLLAAGGSRLQKVVLYLSLLLMFWNMYKTSSRGPWLATITSIVLLFIFSKAKIRKQILTVGALAALVLLLRPGVLDTILNTYSATLNTNTYEGMSFAYRPALFRAVTGALNDDLPRAVMGFGLGSFREKGLVIVLPNIESHRWYTCDSAWLLLAYEGGYVGVLLVAVLLLKPIAMAIRAYRKLPKADSYFCICTVGSLVSFYVVMISVASYGWGQNGNMLWMVIATLVSYIALKNDKEPLPVPIARLTWDEFSPARSYAPGA